MLDRVEGLDTHLRMSISDYRKVVSGRIIIIIIISLYFVIKIHICTEKK